jgi:hypothetical protein
MTEKIHKRVNNSDIKKHVDKLENFETNNQTVYGIKDSNSEGEMFDKTPSVYAVYSYGYHFPMYVYDLEAKVWLGNKDKYSRTTSAHQTKARPSQGIHQWFSTDELRTIIDQGFKETVSKRLESAYDL